MARKIDRERTLAYRFPEVAKEWHPTKNGSLTPEMITARNARKVWWQCSKGHEWETGVGNRSGGSGCPSCAASSQTSFPSLAIYYYILQAYPDAEAEFIVPNSRYLLDIYIPSMNVAIEYDGEYYHRNVQRDIQKDRKMLKEMHHTKIIRVREKKCPTYQSPNPNITFLQLPDSRETSLESIIRLIFKKELSDREPQINLSDDRKHIQRLIDYQEISGSLQVRNPEIAKEWHPINNGNLRPLAVTEFSNKRAWWICQKGHEWEATVNDRSQGYGCPYCSGLKACEDNCLATLKPDLAKEWHPTMNGSLTPKDVTRGSGKKVWWICKQGHEWKAIINSRSSGKGCPHCNYNANHKANKDNCLETLNPELAKEWHPIKNGELTPQDVMEFSNKKIWWQCRKGHEWEEKVDNRTRRGNGCPYCSGRRACVDNCLATINPDLAKEWHPTKNGDFTPQAVTEFSDKKAWWKCKHGLEWQSRVAKRSLGQTRCSECRSERKAAKQLLQNTSI